MATGMRVSLKSHAPLTFPGMLSTAGHCDQSSAAMERFSFRSFYTLGTVVAEKASAQSHWQAPLLFFGVRRLDAAFPSRPPRWKRETGDRSAGSENAPS